MSASLPSVLILGATGVIGRNLVAYLVSRGLVSAIRAVDKRMPPRALMRWRDSCWVSFGQRNHARSVRHSVVLCSRVHAEFFANPLVEFMQADLSEDEHVAMVFRRDAGPFDFVVCCAAETGFGRDEERYLKVHHAVVDVMICWSC